MFPARKREKGEFVINEPKYKKDKEAWDFLLKKMKIWASGDWGNIDFFFSGDKPSSWEDAVKLKPNFLFI